MADILSFDVPTREERLSFLRTCSAKDILNLRVTIHELHKRLPEDYLFNLTTSERIICLRAALICWSVTEGKQVPREMQFRAILADQLGHDSLVSAGTGSGKTLPIAINILLDDPAKRKITITISPLKRLQTSQQEDFSARYGIRTFAINEDTPRDDEWWTTNIYSAHKAIKQPAQHLIVTVEQLFNSAEGHLPRIGSMLRTLAFQKLVARINVDEAHCFYTSGRPLFGLPAFRPAWGKLADLKILLPPNLPWHLFSATFPPHILNAVKEKLLKPTFDYIHLTSNRPNIMYATHLVNKLDDVQNYECFISEPFDLESQPHVLIFVDDKKLTSKITDYLESILPPQHQGKGVVKHYHSAMSKLYLDQTHADFVSPTGTCKILVTTSGQSVGVDFPNVKIVCTVGLPVTVVDALQRGGRAIRVGNEHAIFVVFHETWALEVDEAEYMDGSDPDRPRANLAQHSRAQERAPLSAVRLVQCGTCLRGFYADYLDDQSEEAIIHTSPFCCDRHDNGFSLQNYLPGKLYQLGEVSNRQSDQQVTRTQKRIRPPAERLLLEDRIVVWLENEVQKDPYFRPSYEILSVDRMKVLLRMLPMDVMSANSITSALNETREWEDQYASALFIIIFEFDIEQQSAKDAKEAAKRSRAGRVLTANDGFINQTAESYEGGSTSASKKRRVL